MNHFQTEHPHDFTEGAVRKHGSKMETRKRALETVRSCSPILWSRKDQALHHDWMELAGVHAPTCQFLLDENALGSKAKFIGVDLEESIIDGCRTHYGDDVPAEWVHGSLTSLLRDMEAFQGVGVLVYDSEHAVRGRGTIEAVLPVLSRFAFRQEEKLGEFMLVINVAQRWVDNERDVARYRKMLGDTFGVYAKIDLHRYVSKKMPMLWTAIRLGF